MKLSKKKETLPKSLLPWREIASRISVQKKLKDFKYNPEEEEKRRRFLAKFSELIAEKEAAIKKLEASDAPDAKVKKAIEDIDEVLKDKADALECIRLSDCKSSRRSSTRAATKRKYSDENMDDTTVKKKKTPMKGDDALMCPQCQRNDKGRVVWCKLCRKKRYCLPCIKRWYRDMPEEEFSAKCPVCCNNCNCKSCLRLRMKGLSEPSLEISESDRYEHYCYILNLLLPWFKEFQREQKVEQELEGQIQGIPANELVIEVVACLNGERVYCDRCRTSIVDFHRSCPKCLYDLCLQCCFELCAGCIPGEKEVEIQPYEDHGKKYIFGEESSDERSSRRQATLKSHCKIESNEKDESCCFIWEADKNGSIQSYW